MTQTLCAVTGCSDLPFIEHPIPLCRRDALTVSLTVTDLLHANALHGHTTPGLDIERVSVAPMHVWAQTSHPPVVYFLANGNRVKIGTSANVAARVSTLSFRRGDVLLLLQGGHDLETALHEHFQSDRIGQTEWFVLSTQIRDYIRDRKKAEAALRQPVMPPDEPDETPDETEIIEPLPRPESADEKILKALGGVIDPDNPKTVYIHKDTIGSIAGIEGASTRDNALTRLVKTRKIHRQPGHGAAYRGMYGIGPKPIGAEPGTGNRWPTI